MWDGGILGRAFLVLLAVLIAGPLVRGAVGLVRRPWNPILFTAHHDGGVVREKDRVISRLAERASWRLGSVRRAERLEEAG